MSPPLAMISENSPPDPTKAAGPASRDVEAMDDTSMVIEAGKTTKAGISAGGPGGLAGEEQPPAAIAIRIHPRRGRLMDKF